MTKIFTLAAILSIFYIPVIKAQSTAQKTNYIISISRNVEWPAEMRNESTFRVAVLGSFTLYKALTDELMGRSIFNKNIDVVNIMRPQDLKLADYHIVYIADEVCNKTTINSIISVTQGKGCLLLTETEGSLLLGASINFIFRNGKLYFEVSQINANRQGLKLTTNLMNFAYNK